jgi:hypothetical protein
MFTEWLIATLSVVFLLAMSGFILWEVDRVNRERGHDRHTRNGDAREPSSSQRVEDEHPRLAA